MGLGIVANTPERAPEDISNFNPVSILHNLGSTCLHVPKVVRLK